MIKVFYKNRNTIGQFMVALIFLGTFGFLFTFDGFVSKSQASGCCGGGEAAVTSFAADSSSDYGSDIPMDALVTSGCGGEASVLTNTCSCSDNSSCSNLCDADDENCCGGSVKASQCATDCGGSFCKQSEYCNSDNESSYCNNDPDFSDYYCSRSADGGCSNEYSSD